MGFARQVGLVEGEAEAGVQGSGAWVEAAAVESGMPTYWPLAAVVVAAVAASVSVEPKSYLFAVATCEGGFVSHFQEQVSLSLTIARCYSCML